MTLQPTLKKRRKSYQVPKGSPPLVIKSAYQNKKVFVTTKDFGKWMRGEYLLSERASNNYIHELAVKEFKENLIIQTVQKPDEVLKVIDTHYNQSECNLYIKNQKSGKEKKFIVLSDPKSGKVKLASRVTKEEYTHLKKTGELDLFDLRRDPDLRVMSQKGIDEVNSLKRAQDQNILENLTVRRPFNRSESEFDFIGEASDGTRIEIDVTGTHVKSRDSFEKKVKRIIKHIREDIDTAKDSSKVLTLCDLKAFEADRDQAYKFIVNKLEPNELDKVRFVWE